MSETKSNLPAAGKSKKKASTDPARAARKADEKRAGVGTAGPKVTEPEAVVIEVVDSAIVHRTEPSPLAGVRRLHVRKRPEPVPADDKE